MSFLLTVQSIRVQYPLLKPRGDSEIALRQGLANRLETGGREHGNQTEKLVKILRDIPKANAYTKQALSKRETSGEQPWVRLIIEN